MTGDLYRLAAFAETDGGGNPAGVWVGDALPGDDQMLAIAADVGYSETAFIAPSQGRTRTVRYFSPVAEVPFCGHATIATGAVLGRRDGAGAYTLETRVGAVAIDAREAAGGFTAALTSVATRQAPIADADLDAILEALGWQRDELDTAIPPVLACGGAWHAVIAVRDRSRLAGLDYDFEVLKRIMLGLDLTTVQLVWRERADLFHSRNPFPVGGVVEDPATGAAAAALCGYLRDAGLIEAPNAVTIRQGEDMGRPSVLHVDIPASGGIVVAGAVRDL